MRTTILLWALALASGALIAVQAAANAALSRAIQGNVPFVAMTLFLVALLASALVAATDALAGVRAELDARAWRRADDRGSILGLATMKPALLFLAALLFAPFAEAQDYPSRPLRIIIPASPGGTTDLLARLFAAKLSESFGQSVVAENRASASGVIAGELTAKAPADGYTLLLAYHQHTVNAALNPDLPYHPVNDFTPVTQLTAAGLLLVVNPNSPPHNLREFIDWTKNFQGPLNFGSAGLGSGGHLAGELYKQMTGVKAQHIPYKGSGPAFIDLIGGRYEFNFAGMQGATAQVRGGKLRAIAVTTPKRVAALPDIPAMAEALPGFEVVGWYGVLAPAGLPAPILSKLNSELLKILQQPDVHARILADGSEPVGSTPEEFKRFLDADVAKWAKVVKESGAKLN